METYTYGCLLPILKKNIPSESSAESFLDDLLKQFLEEFQVKERCVSYLENQHTETEKNEHDFTTSIFILKIEH